MDDAPAKKRAQRETELQAIHAALKSKASLPEALNQLAHFFVVVEEENSAAKKKQKTKKNSEVSGRCVSVLGHVALPIPEIVLYCRRVHSGPLIPYTVTRTAYMNAILLNYIYFLSCMYVYICVYIL